MSFDKFIHPHKNHTIKNQNTSINPMPVQSNPPSPLLSPGNHWWAFCSYRFCPYRLFSYFYFIFFLPSKTLFQWEINESYILDPHRLNYLLFFIRNYWIFTSLPSPTCLFSSFMWSHYNIAIELVNIQL